MPQFVSVRTLQSWMGLAYLLLAAIAVARSPTPMAVIVATGMMIGAFLTGRTVPDFQVRSDEILRVSRLGLIVIVAAVAMDMAGGSHALGWAYVVMSYCAGNRLRAAGFGLAG